MKDQLKAADRAQPTTFHLIKNQQHSLQSCCRWYFCSTWQAWKWSRGEIICVHVENYVLRIKQLAVSPRPWRKTSFLLSSLSVKVKNFAALRWEAKDLRRGGTTSERKWCLRFTTHFVGPLWRHCFCECHTRTESHSSAFIETTDEWLLPFHG